MSMKFLDSRSLIHRESYVESHISLYIYKIIIANYHIPIFRLLIFSRTDYIVTSNFPDLKSLRSETSIRVYLYSYNNYRSFSLI